MRDKETDRRIRRTAWALFGVTLLIIAMFAYSVKYGGPLT